MEYKGKFFFIHITQYRTYISLKQIQIQEMGMNKLSQQIILSECVKMLSTSCCNDNLSQKA